MEFKSFREYLSEAKGEITFVFGRFNPPTTGHEKLFDKLKKVSGGSYRIYASKSQDAKKNPLTFKQKIKFMRKMFPKHARNIMADPDVRTVIDIAVKLYDQGYTKVSMVAGSDRVKEFETLLNKYNGQKARHGFYNFEDGITMTSITISPAGIAGNIHATRKPGLFSVYAFSFLAHPYNGNKSA